MSVANTKDSHLYCNQFNATLPDQAMIVCVCHRVSDREIARHARAGMSFDEVQMELGVATQCGQCEGCAREVHAQCCSSHPVAALHRESTPVQLSPAISESRAWPNARRVAA
jgi:bacterioferritin-associated ferredoxin